MINESRLKENKPVFYQINGDGKKIDFFVIKAL